MPEKHRKTKPHPVAQFLERNAQKPILMAGSDAPNTHPVRLEKLAPNFYPGQESYLGRCRDDAMALQDWCYHHLPAETYKIFCILMASETGGPREHPSTRARRRRDVGSGGMQKGRVS